MDGWQYSPPTDQAPRQKRHGIFQFSLRSLLVVMALVAAFFGGRATMAPLLEAEMAQKRTAENRLKHSLVEKAELEARLRSQVLTQLRYQPPPRSSPVTSPVTFEGIERAERVNLWQHQQRYQRLDLDVVPEPLPRGGPAGELPMRVR